VHKPVHARRLAAAVQDALRIADEEDASMASPQLISVALPPLSRAGVRRGSVVAGDSVSAPHAGAADARPRVLLAEDYPINQKLMLLILDRIGLRVDVASNGAEALAKYRAQHAADPYRAILMDVQMPIMCARESLLDKKINRVDR
jgi:DNA-binding response OmpR family regulator